VFDEAEEEDEDDDEVDNDDVASAGGCSLGCFIMLMKCGSSPSLDGRRQRPSSEACFHEDGDVDGRSSRTRFPPT
jgi:hypothetical protein